MKTDVKDLVAKREGLSAYAQIVRSSNQSRDMLILAKILSRQAQLEVQLAALGVPITPAQIQPMKHDELCPF